MNPQHITQLSINNVLRITVASVTPDGKVITVGGQNGSGKTSLLNAIQMALGGTKAVPTQPLHEGTEKGNVEIVLDDLIIKRTFTASGGGSLTVTGKDGSKYKSPQQLLDSLAGKLTFDPLAFIRMKPNDQVEMLKKFTGLDFSELDASRKKYFDERTLVNRDVASAKADLATRTVDHTVAYSQELDARDIQAKLSQAMQTNGTRDALWQRKLNADERRTASIETVRLAEQALANAKARYEAATAEAIAANNAFEQAAYVDIEPLTAQMQSLAETNAAIRNNNDYTKAAAALEALESQSKALTDLIAEHDASKAKALSETKFPIPGLSFDENGVTLNGKPFDQASDAEKIRASVAMGLALNPTLRIVLIRDGSLLDSKSMAIIQEMAEQNNAQIWVERVSDDGAGCQVVMVEGVAYQGAPL